MTRLEFDQLLSEAIARLYEIDFELMSEKFDVNERTITHRLALHLTPLFNGYDVDCEYNRMTCPDGMLTDGDFWAKTLALKPPSVITAEDDEAITVYPDIIIHKRKTSINLAVIEVKMQWKNRKKDFDLKKLKAYRSDLDYQFAVYLELGETPEINRIIF